MQRLAGKIAFVTGASRGIGAACVRRFAAEGATVAIADLDEGAARDLADEIKARGDQASAHRLDINSEANIVDLFATLRMAHGRIDILHNNAADTRPSQLAQDAEIADLTASVWDQAFATNARGTMLMSREAINAMLPNGGGVIINTSSGASIAGDIYNAAYAASKAAVNSLTRYVATQYGKRGIRCNAILPGLVMTDMAKQSLSPAQLNVIDRQTLTPFFGTPEDIAGVAAFLASDDARFMNGQTICVDGGVLIHMPHGRDMADLLTNRDES